MLFTGVKLQVKIKVSTSKKYRICNKKVRKNYNYLLGVSHVNLLSHTIIYYVTTVIDHHVTLTQIIATFLPYLHY